MSLSSPQANSTIKKGPRQDGGRPRSGKATPKTATNLLNIDSLVVHKSDGQPVKPARKAAPLATNSLSAPLEGLNNSLGVLPKIITSLPTATTLNESLTSMLATFPQSFDALSPSCLPPGGLPFGQHLKIDHQDSAYYLIPTGQLPVKSVSIIDQFNFAKDASQLSRADQEITQLIIAFESVTVQLEKKIARSSAMDSAVKERLLSLVDRMYKCLRQDGYDDEQASLSGNLSNNLTSNLPGNLTGSMTGSMTGSLNSDILRQIYGMNFASLRPLTEQPNLAGLPLKDLNNNNLLASFVSLNSPVSINSPTTSSTTNQKQDDEEKDELFPNGGSTGQAPVSKSDPAAGQPIGEEDLQKQLLGEEFMNSCDEFIIDHRKNINQNRIKSSIIGAVKHKQQNLIKKQQSIDDKTPINLTINSPLNSLTGNLAGPANPRRSIRCDQCGTNFTQRNSLNRHLRSHTGEKPFPCKVCEKKFSDKQRLLIHTRIHTGEKPFSCQICDRSFTQKSTVKRHLIVHFGQGSSTTNPNFNNALNLKKKVKTSGKTVRVSRKPSRRSKPDNGGQQDAKREQ